MENILLVLNIILALILVLLVLMQKSEGGALGIGVGDRVYMMEYTWYSVISPESCSSILWRSWDYKEQAAEALKLTSKDLKKSFVFFPKKEAKVISYGSTELALGKF